MLGDLLLELLAVASVTGQEAPLADRLARRYAAEEVQRVGDSLVIGDLDDPRATVALVAHTDTVPPTPDLANPRREGERIVGRGASDMKAGLAVAMACFEDADLRAGPRNLVLVAYAREEGAYADNELADVLATVAPLRRCELAVILEPTDLTVQLGCMGTLHAEVVFSGRAAHSARPWQGVNALTSAAPLLAALDRLGPDDVEVDGLVFREVLVPTQAGTANARNVVPDRFAINLNYRFAPDKTPAQAEQRVRSMVADRAEVAIVDCAPAGRPRRGSPQVEAFVAAAGAAVGPKQAWTDVARFSELGVPALNYGPGLTAQAHQAGEYVPEANLAAARATLARFLAGEG